MKRGFGKDFYRKGNSVKRSGPFSETLREQPFKGKSWDSLGVVLTICLPSLPLNSPRPKRYTTS